MPKRGQTDEKIELGTHIAAPGSFVAVDPRDQYRTAFDASVIGMAIVDLDGTFIQANSALCDITGYEIDQMIGTRFQSITHPDDLESDLELMRQVLAGEMASYQTEKRYIHKLGHAIWIQLSVSLVRTATGEPAYFIAQVQDITERKQFEAQLLHQAFHDPLTRLPNRALLIDRLEHALGRAHREGKTVGVLFLDLDNFKVINDSLGHRAGDQLLMTMAERLHYCVRPGDTVARLAGDEFTILLEGIAGIADAIRVAQRVTEQSLTLYSIGERQVAVTASIGIALSVPEQIQTADDLLRDADTAMYAAKRRGRSRYEVYTPNMSANNRDRLELEIELQRGIERGELELYYQPVVDLATGKVNEIEALVRWNSPERGLVSPSVFIPVAEESGLVLPLGDWVLRRACRTLRRWQLAYPSDPPLTMSVNLSTRQFLQPTLAEDIARTLRETRVDPRTLKLEITERVAMEDAETAIATLRELKSLGLTLAIDDFGTGYSSLSYLKRFSVDILKIDRAFVNGIGRDPEDTAIVDAVIAIAKTLGISVVAEGIETEGQLQHLRDLRCDCGQGYFFAHPMTEAELEALLRSQQTSTPTMSLGETTAHDSAKA